jgi:hypothetical protein
LGSADVGDILEGSERLIAAMLIAGASTAALGFFSDSGMR